MPYNPFGFTAPDPFGSNSPSTAPPYPFPSTSQWNRRGGTFGGVSPYSPPIPPSPGGIVSGGSYSDGPPLGPLPYTQPPPPSMTGAYPPSMTGAYPPSMSGAQSPPAPAPISRNPFYQRRR